MSPVLPALRPTLSPVLSVPRPQRRALSPICGRACAFSGLAAEAQRRHVFRAMYTLGSRAGRGIATGPMQTLYEKYGITDDEVAFIESMIRPMDSTRWLEPIEEILAEKPDARPTIYAYSIDDDSPRGTAEGRADDTRREDPRRRASQDRAASRTTPSILDEPADATTAAPFTRPSRSAPRLIKKGFENIEDLEWMRCALDDVKTVAHRAADRAEAHRHASRDLPHARRAGRRGREDLRLLQLDLG